MLLFTLVFSFFLCVRNFFHSSHIVYTRSVIIMIINDINLKPMNSVGTCRARVYDDGVAIKVYGVAGCLKAWLTGKGGTHEIGNLVNGAIRKDMDTSLYSGILITQSGRQMFYGKFREEEEIIAPTAEEETVPVTEEITIPQRQADSEMPEIFSFDDGYTWREVTEKNFPSDSLPVRYILSHRSFYDAFMQHGRYYYGENGNKVAIAIECDIKNEPHPFPYLSSFSTLRDGYMIVLSDNDTNSFCIYEY